MELIGLILLIVGIILIVIDWAVRPAHSPWLFHVGAIIALIGLQLEVGFPSM